MPHAAHTANSPDLFDAELAAAERAILAQQGAHQNDLRAQALAEAGQASLRIARNHAKVMVGDSPDGDLYFAIESSANVNTNPRIEQTAIHADKALHDHYREFFAGIRSIDRATRQAAKP